MLKLIAPSKTPVRVWINSPSVYEPHFVHHGKNVLAVHEYDAKWRVFFLSGAIESMQVDAIYLSKGWKATNDSITATI